MKTADEKIQKNDSPKRSFLMRLASDFFLGCLALLPLAAFSFILYYLIYLVESVGSAIFGITKSRWSTILVCLFLIVLLIYCGRKLRRRENSLLSLFEKHIILKIPVIGSWYETFRDIVQNLTGRNKESYLGTAKVPVTGGYILGFVTKRELLADGTAQVTVFVPTSPNPTTGLVFFFPEAVVEYCDMTPEKAFTTIISLGVKS